MWDVEIALGRAVGEKVYMLCGNGEKFSQANCHKNPGPFTKLGSRAIKGPLAQVGEGKLSSTNRRFLNQRNSSNKSSNSRRSVSS